MKKIMSVLFAFLFTSAVFAQSSQDGQMHDGFIMKKGKMIAIKNGQTKLLDKNITLSNGSIVMANGTVKMKDGKTKVLKEGDYISVDGKTGIIRHGKVIEDKEKKGESGETSIP
ncbi:MAG: DUF6799 domain-containing protein [Ginsengibacter sp.]